VIAAMLAPEALRLRRLNLRTEFSNCQPAILNTARLITTIGSHKHRGAD